MKHASARYYKYEIQFIESLRHIYCSMSKDDERDRCRSINGLGL